jgi:DNA-binding MarR family transcriptional regulator
MGMTAAASDEVKQSPAYQLWLASNAWVRVVRKALEPLDLTHVQYVVLSSAVRLAREHDVVTQADVCRFAALDENMMSQVVKTLVGKGLLERVPHPDDRRAHVLVPTDVGLSLAEAARAAVKPATERFFASLGSDLPNFTRLLRTLNGEDAGDGAPAR